MKRCGEQGLSMERLVDFLAHLLSTLVGDELVSGDLNGIENGFKLIPTPVITGLLLLLLLYLHSPKKCKDEQTENQHYIGCFLLQSRTLLTGHA